MLRSLPITVPPLPGEALDSWFEVTAHRLRTPLSDLLPALGLARRVDAGDCHRDIPARWAILLRDNEAADISHATGVNSQVLHAMTLAHFDGRALRIKRETRQVSRWHHWGRQAGSRFCPDCLAETKGRWKLSWRLGWMFACLDHSRLLADACSQCGQMPWKRLHQQRYVPEPGKCAFPGQREEPGKRHQRCGYRLSQVASIELGSRHTLLTAQKLLTKIAENDSAEFGIYASAPRSISALEALADLRALSSRLLADATDSGLANVLPHDTREIYEGVKGVFPEVTGAVPARRSLTAPVQAIGISAALQVLGQSDVHAAGRELRHLVAAADPSETLKRLTGFHRMHGITPLLSAVQLTAQEPMLRPSDQLRYRLPAFLPSRPSPRGGLADQRVHKIPSCFWPGWSVLLSPPQGAYTRTFRPCLSASLALVGTRDDLRVITRRLGGVTTRQMTSKILQLLYAQGLWSVVNMALVRLADYLDAHEVPIDYQRRRMLDYTDLLPEARWRQICDDAGVQPGQGRRLTVARSTLFEQMSGLPAHLAPAHFAITRAMDRPHVNYFAAFLTPEVRDGLHRAGADFLAQHGIEGEPLAWEPPTVIADGLEAAGHDLEKIDISCLHHMVRSPSMTTEQAARELGTSHEAVRVLLHRSPAPAQPRPRSRRRNDGEAMRIAKQAFPPDDFRRLYYTERLGLRQIADLAGVSRNVTRRLAEQYGIEIREPNATGPRKGYVDGAWLREQYLVHGRTLAELGREKGLSPTTMTRWAKLHGIPVTKVNGHTRPELAQLAAQASKAPEILRPAFTGSGAWDRLREFASVSRYRTLKEAAEALGTHHTALITRVGRLGREIGHPLLIRATTASPMKLTPIGEAVVAAIHAAAETGLVPPIM
ncbi:TniQ family protein [Streptomyces halstedii]|uniref:TniQ family protein n=1 Tax=Streptomyces TaxID=1883 RepID=UPI0005631098|nr:TniQ family protein [Streptomyces sp. NTK 937]WSX40035.1 TniQ family protein [Streptomyces halstedii]